MRETVEKLYGNKVRVRACGLLIIEDSILLVSHRGIGPSANLLLPPGGGVAYGEELEHCLLREFREETGLTVEVGPLKFVYEFIQAPFHAVEFFFEVKNPIGNLITGIDPEMAEADQIIDDVRYVTFEELCIIPINNLHGIFKQCKHPSDINRLAGLYKGC